MDDCADRPTVIVRERCNADLAGAARVLVQVHAVDGYPVEGVARPTAWLQPPGLRKAWVAEADGRTLGHVALCDAHGEDAVQFCLTQEPDAKVAVLARLFVEPTARKRAVGRHLVGAVIGYTHSHGLRAVGEVMMKDMAAIRLYQRMGCYQIGITQHRYGDGQQTPAMCFSAP